jgi:hypothetical protein
MALESLLSSEGDERKFQLRAILMWCIHDFPAYDLVSGQVTKGYKGCQSAAQTSLLGALLF